MIKLKPFPIQIEHFLTPLLVLVIATVAFFLNQQLSDSFIYNRDLIGQGEYWRLLTGHFFHTNFNHLMLNSAAILLLWALHGQFYSISNYLFNFIFCALVTSSALYFYSPELFYYVGLSGVLHGFFIWGALKDIEHHDRTGYWLLLGITVKLLHEQLVGASADVAALIEANVAVDAHLWGAIAGAVYFLGGKVIRLRSLSSDNK